jgi:transposase
MCFIPCVMSLADSLPSGLEELRAFALAALAERDAAIAERDEARTEIDKIRHLLKRYTNGKYGPKSEKLGPDQLKLAPEDMEQALAKSEAIDQKKSKTPARPRKANRGALPAHLPQIHVMLAPEETTSRCCQRPMHMIDDETSSRLDVIPAQLRVIVTPVSRPKRWWPMCWSPNMADICRSIAKRRSMRRKE